MPPLFFVLLRTNLLHILADLQGNHQFLGSQSSSSFVDTKKQFQVTYGTGAVAGDIVQDDVNLAGLALTGHTFGVATAETVDFSDNSVPFDGLMGLAQSVRGMLNITSFGTSLNGPFVLPIDALEPGGPHARRGSRQTGPNQRCHHFL